MSRAFVLFMLVISVAVFFLSPRDTASATERVDVVVGYTDGSFTTVSFNSNQQYSNFIQTYGSNPRVSFIEKNAQYQQARVPNDTLFSSQNNLIAINAPEAWDIEKGLQDNVIVAVLDAGVDISHSDLSPRIWVNEDEIPGNKKDDDHNGYVDDRNGWDFADSSTDITPHAGSSLTAEHHGTVIAGIIGATGNNTIGVSGVAWGITIMPVRVLGVSGSGNSVDVAQGVKYAADNGADIINLSFVGPTSSTLLMQAIQYARSRGVLVIASAGNDNVNLNTTPKYPVCHTGVIGVASVTNSGVKSSFSNYGSSCIDISAPGENILSTVSTESGTAFPSGYSSGWNGTSFSSPVVAGVAALAFAHQPEITREQLETLLVNSASSLNNKNPSYQNQLGSGLISAVKAVVVSTPPTLRGATILTFPLTNGGPQLRWFSQSGSAYRNAFIAHPDYRGTGSIAVCDIDGNGKNEILYGSGGGVESRIHLISHEGVDVWSFRAFSSPQNGVRIACADTNGDGVDDMIAIREEGSVSEIRIFYQNGAIRKRFFAWSGEFMGGMDIAAGDLNNDGKAEIIAGMGSGGLPRVQVFNEDGVALTRFFAYGLGYRGGVNVSTGDVDGDGRLEIVTAPRSHGGPHVRIFSSSGLPERGFFAYGEGFHGGVSIATGDVDGDGIDDIITGAGQGGGPHVRAFHGYGTLTSIASFFAYSESFRGGVQVATFTTNK